MRNTVYCIALPHNNAKTAIIIRYVIHDLSHCMPIE